MDKIYYYFSYSSYNEKGEVSTKENEVVELDEKEVNLIYVPQEIQDAITHGLTDGYEFNAEQIKFEECLGRGAFGYVHRARALGITAEPEWTLVAVKTLNGKTIVNGDMVWKPGKLQSVHNELQVFVELASRLHRAQIF